MQNSKVVSKISNSYEETRLIGKKLGELLAGGEVLALVGELGSGKTVFVQGVAQGLSVQEWVTSPSFVLAREYQGRLTLQHLDFYRIDSANDVLNIGFEDYLSKEKAVTIIEWADKVYDVLPRERLEITFIIDPEIENRREIQFQPYGSQHLDLLHKLKF